MSNSDGAATVERLFPAEFRDFVEAGEPIVVLDVRERFEREFALIPIASSSTELHVPMSQIPAKLPTILEAAGGRRLVVYCHHGVRSLMAARWLASQGVESIANLEGGIDAYSIAADPKVPRY